MREKKTATQVCQICGTAKNHNELVSAELVRGAIVDLIRKQFPEWSPAGFICANDLHRFRGEYVEDILESEKGELSSLEEQVLKSLREQDLLSSNVNEEFDKGLTFGQRLADRIASFGGSWPFILLFGGILVLWIGVNSALILRKPFDPFPYILLNLVLSCLAAVQAPVIMMSQNRQESRDRLRSENDYRINLKAELEIRHLHEKIDHLLSRQWSRLAEIQRVQLDLMEEVAKKAGGGSGA